MTTDCETMLFDAVDALSLPPKTQVLVAVSGGADSVALALTFSRLSLQPDKQWRVRLAHVNHGLRGSQSDEDEAFVLALAQRLQVKSVTARVNTREFARQHRQSIETAARELRYRELLRMRDDWSGGVIAVGHHLDDQAETVLMNLTRGAGIDGLAGMSVRSGALVRPFLHTSRETIVAAMRSMDEPYRIDDSNAEPGPRRNQLRLAVFPLLEAITPGAGRTIARNTSLLRDDAAYLDEEAEHALRAMEYRADLCESSASVAVFRALHPSLQGRVLRMMVRDLVGDTRDLSQDHVLSMREAIIGSYPGPARGLPRQLRFQVEGDRFNLLHGDFAPHPALESAYLPVPGELENAFGRLEVTLVPPEAYGQLAYSLVVCGPYHAFCDADVLGDHVLIRSRRQGDRIHRRNAPGSRKVHDMFIDSKIPGRKRDRIPVLLRADTIVWVPGFEIAQEVSITPETVRVAHLRYRSFL